jgi:hypothetical protein
VSRLVLPLVLAVAVACPHRATAAVTLVPGGEVDASPFAGAQHSPALVVDPDDPTRLVLVAGGPAGLFAARSLDGGATWIPLGGDGAIAGTVQPGADPALAWDRYGNLFLAYRTPCPPDSPCPGFGLIQVYVSTDGGSSFVPATAAFMGSNVGRPALATGGHAGSVQGTVWVAYAAGNVIVGRGSVVSGPGVIGPFSLAQTAPDSIGGAAPALAVGPTGDVVLAYLRPGNTQGPADIRVHRDANGTFAGGFDAGVVVATTEFGGMELLPTQPTAGLSASLAFAWDTIRGRLFLVHATEEGAESDDTDVALRVSTDGGITWGAPVRVNDDPPGPSQIMPRVAVDGTTGAVAVAWLDARDDPANVGLRLREAVSLDGGATFTPSVAASLGLTPPVPPVDHGARIALVASPRTLVAAWADAADALGENPDGTAAPDVHVVRTDVVIDCLTDAECDDRDPCNGAERCEATTCVDGADLADGTPCDDGDACTRNDVCAAGGCVGGAAVDCAPCFLCDPAVGCTARPSDACRPAGGSRASTLRLTRRRGGRLHWTWRGDGAAGEFGSPKATTEYEFCIFDGVGGAPRLAFADILPPASICAHRPCWSATRRGFRFQDRAPTPQGVADLSLRRRRGRTTIAAAGHGRDLDLPALPLGTDPGVTVQLRSSAGMCWESRHVAPVRNDGQRFRD